MAKLLTVIFFALAITTTIQTAKAADVAPSIAFAPTPAILIFAGGTASASAAPSLKVSYSSGHHILTSSLIAAISRINLDQFPERAGLLLIGSSLIGIGGGLRRKRRKALESN